MQWTDFLTALGLVFVIEGVAYALFPEGFKKLFIAVIEHPVAKLRAMGLMGVIVGVAIIWIARG